MAAAQLVSVRADNAGAPTVVNDELAERRAANGIVTIKIAAGDASVVRHVRTRQFATQRRKGRTTNVKDQSER